MMLEEMRLKKSKSQDNNMIEFVIQKGLKHVIDVIGIQEGKAPKCLEK